MAEHEPAVRRLCIATASGSPGLLTLVQQSEAFYRICLTAGPTEGVELAFASPGLDEMSLVPDLIAAMHKHAMAADCPQRPALAGFHVGITRIVDEGFGGSGADRTLALIHDPAILAAIARAGNSPLFAVAVTTGLFADLHAEGLSDSGWQSIPAADAWLKLFSPVQN